MEDSRLKDFKQISHCFSVWVVNDVVLELFELNASRVVCVNDFEEGVHILTFNRNLKLGDHVCHLVNR